MNFKEFDAIRQLFVLFNKKLICIIFGESLVAYLDRLKLMVESENLGNTLVKILKPSFSSLPTSIV